MALLDTPATTQSVDAFIYRLRTIADLPTEVCDELKGLVANIRLYSANQDIVQQGDRPSQCCVILDGWICRNKMTSGGKRQITAMHFAGTVPDLQSLFAQSMDHNITALTDVRAGFIAHAALRSMMDKFPALTQAFWQETLIDAAISRELAVNLGSRSAPQRIAHLFCETATRLERLGRIRRKDTSLSLPWPLSQAQLGDATGLSAVHVNRSLRALRIGGLITPARERVLQIHDLDRLKTYAEFNSDYLQAELPKNVAEATMARS